MSKLYVQNGRLGDILALLPLLYSDHQRTGIKSGLMVSKEFASVLDGCSYVEPIVFDGDYRDLERAVINARAVSDEVVVTSIHGTDDVVAKYAYSQIGQTGATASSFQKQAWLLAGRLHEWDDCLPLVFDRRSPEREQQLLDANGFKKQNKKPVLLLAVDGGVTSPFPHAKLLCELVVAKFGKQYRIIDLPMVDKEVLQGCGDCDPCIGGRPDQCAVGAFKLKSDGRIYDLLAVMERSALLITIDSMPLHLAWACRSLPVFALTNDRDAQGNPSLWHGSPWRPNHLWYCRYSDWPARAVEMVSRIEAMSDMEIDADYVHIFQDDGGESHPLDWHHISIRAGLCSREFNGRPFVKDVIRMGIQRAFTNETAVQLSRPNIFGVFHAKPEPFFAYRLQKGQHVPIVDLYSAPKSFWKTIRPEIPDLLLDNDDSWWSHALWAIFVRHGAKNMTGCCEFVGESK